MNQNEMGVATHKKRAMNIIMKSLSPPHNVQEDDDEKRRPDMNEPKTRAYRVAVTVAFGLVGFGVKFLDFEFIRGATFKMSILAGQFFPLAHRGGGRHTGRGHPSCG